MMIMSAAGEHKEARVLLRDEKVVKDLMESDSEVLFGKPFSKQTKVKQNTTKGLVDFLNRNKKKTSSSSKRLPPPRRKPNQNGPLSNSGGRGQGSYSNNSNYLGSGKSFFRRGNYGGGEHSRGQGKNSKEVLSIQDDFHFQQPSSTSKSSSSNKDSSQHLGWEAHKQGEYRCLSKTGKLSQTTRPSSK